MSSVIAIVKSVVAQVFALSPEGIQRLLIEGDRLFKGDQIITGSAGMVSLVLADGRIIDLGRDSQWQASAEEPKNEEGNAEGETVDELQQAIAAGVDPTEALDSSAAGPSATAGLSDGGGTSGGHGFIQLAETAERLDPSIGFATQGLDFSAAALDEELSTGTQDNNATVILDTGATASLSVDPITSDDLLNASEAASNVNVSGTVGGDAALGDSVTFSVNGSAYSGAVIDLGGGVLGFSIAVAGSDLAADTSFDVSVSGSDGAGNPFSATATSSHGVDTTATASLSVDPIT
ncbi:retention module-containing protein, partial [Pseudomonas sp. 2FE]|uniref:retention module-containing protein n=1 Tax=Pseudomonas sp. 2FE TaxID=2502190 RepID=UPI001485651E